MKRIFASLSIARACSVHYVSRNAFALLRRAALVASERINVVKSLHATIAAGGWPLLHHLQRRTNVELVLLVDRGRSQDHLGYLADILVDRLRAAQAFVTRYDYRFHPARVTLASGRSEGPATQDLARVAHRHTDHRLLLVTDGEGLFLPGTTTLDPSLARELARFGHAIVLTPTPPEFWGERERALVALGVAVVPATAGGLDRAARLVTSTPEDITKTIGREIPEGFDPFLERLERDFHRFSSNDPPPAREIAELAMQLEIWMLSRENYKVLAAIAAFPWIDPGLTLAFGAAILERPVDPALFARVARLPWMRSARLPDWLRIALVNRLSDDNRKLVADRMATVLSRGARAPRASRCRPKNARRCRSRRRSMAGKLRRSVTRGVRRTAGTRVPELPQGREARPDKPADAGSDRNDEARNRRAVHSDTARAGRHRPCGRGRTVSVQEPARDPARVVRGGGGLAPYFPAE